LLLILLVLSIGFLVSARIPFSKSDEDADRFGKWGMLLLAALLAVRASSESLGEFSNAVEWIISLIFFLWAITWVWIRLRRRRV
jgi:hypothetical protein